MFIFGFILAFNVIGQIQIYQYELLYDVSDINQTLSEVYGTGDLYELTPGEASNFQFTFGDFMRGASAIVAAFLQSTIYLPYILVDLGFPAAFSAVISIPYNLIVIYGFAQFISNRLGRGR